MASRNNGRVVRRYGRPNGWPAPSLHCHLVRRRPPPSPTAADGRRWLRDQSHSGDLMASHYPQPPAKPSSLRVFFEGRVIFTYYYLSETISWRRSPAKRVDPPASLPCENKGCYAFESSLLPIGPHLCIQHLKLNKRSEIRNEHAAKNLWHLHSHSRV